MGVETEVKIQQLPRQLLDYTIICLEERLYAQAFALLSRHLPLYLPTPQVLALAATLIVHPSLTTRTTSLEKHAAAHLAFSYLTQVISLGAATELASGGTVGELLSAAFSFGDSDARDRRAERVRNRGETGQLDNPQSLTASINLPAAQTDGLFSRAEDFWKVVGWAFTCSALHPARWGRWKLWLELIIAMLEDDLASCTQGMSGRTVTSSLIAHYLEPFRDGGRSSRKAFMRAIFADGGDKSRNEFTEIWKNETKKPKVDTDDLDRQRFRNARLDIDQNDYGDYGEESDENSMDDDDATQPPAQRSVRRRRAVPSVVGSAVSDDPDDAMASFGGIQTIGLRHCILRLLTKFCTNSANQLCDLEDLLDLYVEFIRPLPLPLFQAFILPTRRYLDVHTQISLDLMLLRPLLAGSPGKYEVELTQRDFETYLAPSTANGTNPIDNTKVSLLLEDVLRLLWRSGILSHSESLVQSIDEGIKLRRAKASWDGKKRRANEAQIFDTLDESAKRMKLCVGMLSNMKGPVTK